jgi:hypothetical protein
VTRGTLYKLGKRIYINRVIEREQQVEQRKKVGGRRRRNKCSMEAVQYSTVHIRDSRCRLEIPKGWNTSRGKLFPVQIDLS